MRSQARITQRRTPPARLARAENGSNGSQLEPTLEFLRTLWLLNHRLETASKQMMGAIGVSGPQRMVLRIVGTNPGIGAGTLAQLLHINPGTLSSALKRLEQNGFLLRRPDPGDRRRILVALTPAGRALNQPMPQTIESGVRDALSRLSRQDIDRTQQVLMVLSNSLELEMNGM